MAGTRRPVAWMSLLLSPLSLQVLRFSCWDSPCSWRGVIPNRLQPRDKSCPLQKEREMNLTLVKIRVQEIAKRQSAAAKAATNPPREVQASASGLYPESVISEDISTSLTAYYQSGMGNKRMGSNMLNDAASVSSMESYGYSLDGYANSIAPTDAKDDPY